MDPNEILRLMRLYVEGVRACSDDLHVACECSLGLTDFADQFDNFDSWLVRGGYFPDSWSMFKEASRLGGAP